MSGPAPSTVVVAGASRGIGGAVARHCAAKGARVLGLSRGPAAAGAWIEADLSTPQGLARACRETLARLGDAPLDALLFMGGTWEDGAFTDAYRFLATDAAETRRILAVNLEAPIELARTLAPSLARAPRPLVALMGANMAVEGRARPEVANTASKAGLTGAAAALRATLRPMGVATTVLNPANIATEEVLDDIAAGRFGPQTPIPMSDVLATLDWLMALSGTSEIEEVRLGQRDPG